MHAMLLKLRFIHCSCTYGLALIASLVRMRALQKRDQPEHRTERLLAGLPVLEEEPLEALACLSPHGSANAGTPPPTQRKDSNEGGSNGGDMV